MSRECSLIQFSPENLFKKTSFYGSRELICHLFSSSAKMQPQKIPDPYPLHHNSRVHLHLTCQFGQTEIQGTFMPIQFQTTAGHITMQIFHPQDMKMQIRRQCEQKTSPPVAHSARTQPIKFMSPIGYVSGWSTLSCGVVSCFRSSGMKLLPQAVILLHRVLIQSLLIPKS